MSNIDVRNEVMGIVREVLGAPDAALTEATAARDVPGWDSVKMVEMILRVEERFGIALKARDVDRLRNIGDLVAAVRARLA